MSSDTAGLMFCCGTECNSLSGSSDSMNPAGVPSGWKADTPAAMLLRPLVEQGAD